MCFVLWLIYAEVIIIDKHLRVLHRRAPGDLRALDRADASQPGPTGLGTLTRELARAVRTR
jgi:hypothetical protein